MCLFFCLFFVLFCFLQPSEITLRTTEVVIHFFKGHLPHNRLLRLPWKRHWFLVNKSVTLHLTLFLFNETVLAWNVVEGHRLCNPFTRLSEQRRQRERWVGKNHGFNKFYTQVLTSACAQWRECRRQRSDVKTWRSKRFYSIAVLCVSFTWQIVKTRVIRLRVTRVIKMRSVHAIHSWWKSKWMLAAFLRRMCNNNLEIRIAGSSCRPQQLSVHAWDITHRSERDSPPPTPPLKRQRIV